MTVIPSSKPNLCSPPTSHPRSNEKKHTKHTPEAVVHTIHVGGENKRQRSTRAESRSIDRTIDDRNRKLLPFLCLQLVRPFLPQRLFSQCPSFRTSHSFRNGSCAFPRPSTTNKKKNFLDRPHHIVSPAEEKHFKEKIHTQTPIVTPPPSPGLSGDLHASIPAVRNSINKLVR